MDFKLNFMMKTTMQYLWLMRFTSSTKLYNNVWTRIHNKPLDLILISYIGPHPDQEVQTVHIFAAYQICNSQIDLMQDETFFPGSKYMYHCLYQYKIYG